MTAALTISRRVPASEQLSRVGVVATTLAGTGVGVAYGVAIRAWMRLVADDPEFTWGGTVFIVMAFAILGTFAGLVHAGRGRGWKAMLVVVRVPAVVVGALCFMGAGMLMLPTVVLGGLALARSDWPRVLRAVLAAVALAGVVPVVASIAGIPFERFVPGLVLYVGLALVEVRLFAEIYAPSVGRLPCAVKVGLGVVAALAAGFVVLNVIGTALR
jgi:hypothetical protein